MVDSGTSIVPLTQGVKSSITEWFSRPQLIQTLPWIEGGTINTSISPLAQFFDPTLTSNWDKLKGYSRLRGNLHLKIELNASPFHYGAINVSWAPLTTEYGNKSAGKINYDCLNSFSGASLSAYGDMGGDTQSALMRTTQRLNGFLYPQDCNSLDFNIPFFYPKEFIELRSFPYEDNTYSKNSLELYQFGSLTFVTAVPLQVAQALTGGIVTINVFAWMSDVQLEGPSLVLTSGVAAVAGEAMASFKDTPIIGGYLARAGAISKASAKVMELLGMSNRPDDKPPVNTQPTVLPAFSSPEVDTNSRYLGLAPHSGLSMSLTESWSDELQIDQFGKPITYLSTANWLNTNGKGTLIFSANVTPELYVDAILAGDASGSTSAITTIPACYVSSLFGQWRGKLKYHFTAVCSQFHRGRLRFYYDASVPVAFKEGFIFSKVWDISESKNFEFEVPFTASTQMLALAHPQFSGTADTYNFTYNGSTSNFATLDPRFHNGRVTLEVLNQLLGPNAATVRIMCFVSISGLEFAEPVEPGSFVRTTDQVGSHGLTYLTLEHDFKTTSGDVPSDHKPFDPDIYNGEKVLSLRTILHRSTNYGIIIGPTVAFTADTGGSMVSKYVIPREPLSPGEHSYGTGTNRVSDIGATKFANNLNLTSVVGSTATNRVGYNFAAMTPFVFLKGMFAGYRGSFRWKLLAENPTIYPGLPNVTAGLGQNVPAVNASIPSSLTVARSRDYTGFNISVNNLSATTVNQVARSAIDQGLLRGAEVNTSVFGNSVSIDAPQYSRYKFLPTNDVIRSFERTSAPSAKLGIAAGVDGIYSVASDSIAIDTVFYNPVMWRTGGATVKPPSVRAYVSCGTDFSFVGFINTPIIYSRTTSASPN